MHNLIKLIHLHLELGSHLFNFIGDIGIKFLVLRLVKLIKLIELFLWLNFLFIIKILENV